MLYLEERSETLLGTFLTTSKVAVPFLEKLLTRIGITALVKDRANVGRALHRIILLWGL